MEEGLWWRWVSDLNMRGGWGVRRATSRRRELTLVAGQRRGGGIRGGRQHFGGSAHSQLSAVAVADPTARGGWKGVKHQSNQ
jgi:hypothetical protein